MEEISVNWSGAMLLQIEVGPGSSGSAVFSEKQDAIIGFVVGHAGPVTVAVPTRRTRHDE